MITKAQTVELKRGQPLDYTVVFYGNGGQNGIDFRIIGPGNKIIPLQFVSEKDSIDVPDNTWVQDFCDGDKNFWNFSGWHVYWHRDGIAPKDCEKMCKDQAKCETFLTNPHGSRCHLGRFNGASRTSVACRSLSHCQWFGKVKRTAYKSTYDWEAKLTKRKTVLMPNQW